MIATIFHSFDTGNIPYSLAVSSCNCNDCYILSYMHMQLKILLTFNEGIGPE